MKYNIFKYTFLLIILTSSESFAQNYHINYEHITTKQGLSNNFVNHIIQDSEGFIWIATQDGLNRYDGYNFEIFRVKPYDDKGLPSNLIRCLYEDKEGNIWIGTDKGVAKWNRQHNTIQKISSIPKKPVNYIYQDSQDNIWIVGTIFLKIDKQGKIQDFSEPFLEKGKNIIYYINQITVLGEQKLILISERYTKKYILRYLYFFEEDTQSWQLMLVVHGNIQHINHKGEVLISYLGGRNVEVFLENYSRGLLKVKTVAFPSSNYGVNRGLDNVKSRNNVWCVEYDAIFLVNLDNASISKVLDQSYFAQELDDYDLKGIIKDNNNNLWLYGHGMGLFIFPEYTTDNIKLYHFQKNQQGISGNSVRTVYQEDNGTLWIVTYNHESMQESKEVHLNFVDILIPGQKPTRLLLEGVAHTILPDKDKKTMWVGTHLEHLYKVDKQSKKILKQYKKGGTKILPLSANNFLTNAQNMSVFNTQTGKSKSYKQKKIIYLYRSKDNNIWLGSKIQGLGLLNTQTMQVQYFSHQKNNPQSISSNHVKCIYEDSKGRFWVATTLGLNLFDIKTKTFKAFLEEDGLPNNMVYGILEDKKGNLWLSTNKGISKFNPETQSFINYDESYGLQDNEFNTNAFFKNEETGEMFFGGIKGLNSFYPEKMKRNEFPPKVVWKSFKRKGKTVDLGKPLTQVKQITMNYEEAQSLSFEFVALNYFQSYKNEYTYKIEEIHQDWIHLGTRHDLSLTNLNAGTYTLRIKASNNHGLWNGKGLKIILMVKPPFWQTWWFRTILVLLFLALVYGVYRWRMYQVRRREKYLENEVNTRTEEIQAQAESLEELNQTKDRLFSIIAHDLRSPMAAFESITQQLDFYIEQNELERIKTLNQHIKTSSHNINTLLNNLLSWALMQKNLLSYHAEQLGLREITEDVLRNYRVSLENYQIQTQINIEDDLEISIDENALRTILRNLISNAIKFTPQQGLIIVSAYEQQKYTIIEINDSGKGMSEDMLNNIFKVNKTSKTQGLRGERGTGLGLLLVREFVQLSEGIIEVNSEENEGTHITLKFPKSSSC